MSTMPRLAPAAHAAPPVATRIATLLENAGTLDGAHVLVIGEDTLDLMCALIHSDCAAAADIHPHDVPLAEPADIVLVPEIGSFATALKSVALARRALLPGGRIVLADASGRMARTLREALRTHGFSAIRIRVSMHCTIILAERPSFGPIHDLDHAGAPS